MLLDWKPVLPEVWEATLGSNDDHVLFQLLHVPSCYRRGPYKLMVEVCGGKFHYSWGCFDDQDQPIRWYHREASARAEAEAIAQVLLTDRKKTPPPIDWFIYHYFDDFSSMDAVIRGHKCDSSEIHTLDLPDDHRVGFTCPSCNEGWVMRLELFDKQTLPGLGQWGAKDRKSRAAWYSSWKKAEVGK